MSSKKPKKKPDLLQQRNQNKQLRVGRGVAFSGPIPPPDVLEHYNKILDGAANRILSMAENQATHRYTLEKTVIQSNIQKEKRGQWFGLIIGLFSITGGVVCILYGHDGAGGTLATIDITGLAAVFVAGKKLSKKELAQKHSLPK